MTDADPLACAAFLITAFILAGLVQTAWLRSPLSRRFGVPLDGARTFRGQRVLGDNKTLRGFLLMVPAAGAACSLLAWLRPSSPSWLAQGLWPLTPGGYWWLGVGAGFGFMAGELPNSFLKRQLGVPPGAAPHGRLARSVGCLVDHLDSIVGMLAAVSLLVPTPPMTWMYVLVIGPGIHLGFSHLLFLAGGKGRAA